MNNLSVTARDEAALESINSDFLELHGINSSLESLLFNLELNSHSPLTEQGLSFAQQHLNQLRTQCGMESISFEDGSSLLEKARDLLKKLMAAIRTAIEKMSEIIQRIISKMRLGVKKSVEELESFKQKVLSLGLHNAGHTLTITAQRRGLTYRGSVVKNLEPMIEFLKFTNSVIEFISETSKSIGACDDVIVHGLKNPLAFKPKDIGDIVFASPKGMSRTHNDERGATIFESTEQVGGFSYTVSFLTPADVFKKNVDHHTLPATGFTFQLDVAQPDVANEEIEIIFFPAQQFDKLIETYWKADKVMSVLEDDMVQNARNSKSNLALINNAIRALDDRDYDETIVDQMRAISRVFTFCVATKKQCYSFGRLVFANFLTVLEAHKHWAEESVRQASLDVVKDSAKKK